MTDFSGLVGRYVKGGYDQRTLFVHGVYLHDGQVVVIVSTDGGPIYTTNLESLTCEHS